MSCLFSFSAYVTDLYVEKEKNKIKSDCDITLRRQILVHFSELQVGYNR